MFKSFLQKHPTFLPISFLTSIILIPYWRLALMQGFLITDDIFTSDIMNDAFPYRFYLSEVLKSGQLPLWYPPVYSGFPLLARAEAGIVYPINLILFGLLPPYPALNAIVLLTLIIAAVGMYLYAREIDAGNAGAVVAAVSFAYSGFFVAHLKHVSTVNTACWLPLGLFFIERAFKQAGSATISDKSRPFILFSFVVALQYLGGHIQTAYYCGLIYVVYFLFKLFNTREKAAPRRKKDAGDQLKARPNIFRDHRVAWFTLSMILGVGISAVQLLPTYELVTLSQRSGGVTFEYASNYAYDPSNIKTFFYPYANGDIGNATYRGKSIFWEDFGYVGVLTILLALYAAISLWRKPHVKFYAIVAVVAYFLVLGPNTPVYKAVFYLVPGMQFFRFPTRFLLVVDASIVLLAAFGVSNVLSRMEGKRQSSEATISRAGYVLIALVVIDLLYFQMRQNSIVKATDWMAQPKTVQKIKEDRGVFRIYSPGASEAHKLAFSRAKGWQGDLRPYIDQREFIQPSLNVLYGLSTADGYAQLTPNYVVDLWGDQNRGGWIYETATVDQGGFAPRPAFMKIISMFNIKYLITPWPVFSDSLEKVESPESVFMYRNPHVMPRAFVVGKYRVAPNPEGAKAILLSDEFDPGREVILYKKPGQSGNDEMVSTVSIEQYRTNEVVLRVKASVKGVLVLSDTYYPGWRSFVDGTEKEILQANICQRGVEIPAGEHEVRFVFDSFPVKAGFGVSVTSLVLAAVLLIALRPRR